MPSFKWLAGLLFGAVLAALGWAYSLSGQVTANTTAIEAVKEDVGEIKETLHHFHEDFKEIWKEYLPHE